MTVENNEAERHQLLDDDILGRAADTLDEHGKPDLANEVRAEMTEEDDDRDT